MKNNKRNFNILVVVMIILIITIFIIFCITFISMVITLILDNHNFSTWYQVIFLFLNSSLFCITFIFSYATLDIVKKTESNNNKFFNEFEDKNKKIFTSLSKFEFQYFEKDLNKEKYDKDENKKINDLYEEINLKLK